MSSEALAARDARIQAYGAEPVLLQHYPVLPGCPIGIRDPCGLRIRTAGAQRERVLPRKRRISRYSHTRVTISPNAPYHSM